MHDALVDWMYNIVPFYFVAHIRIINVVLHIFVLNPVNLLYILHLTDQLYQTLNFHCKYLMCI